MLQKYQHYLIDKSVIIYRYLIRKRHIPVTN